MLGAEIRGVNAADALAADIVSELRRVFLDHLVIFFRDQKLTPPEQLSFASARGTRSAVVMNPRQTWTDPVPLMRRS